LETGFFSVFAGQMELDILGPRNASCARWTAVPESPVIKLILAMEEFGKRFPGFERGVHGIEVDSEGNYWMRAVIETPKV
jgi:hypothetical protein